MNINDFYPALALLLVIFSNNLLGSCKSMIDGSFDKTTAILGLQKGAIVTLAVALMYAAGLLVPDITLTAIEGLELTLAQAIQYILTGGFAYYAALDIQKLLEIIKLPTTGPKNIN